MPKVIFIIASLVVCIFVILGAYIQKLNASLDNINAANDNLKAINAELIEANRVGLEQFNAGLKAVLELKQKVSKEVRYIEKEAPKDTTCIDAINSIYKRLHEQLSGDGDDAQNRAAGASGKSDSAITTQAGK